jgi:hypothetical protein
MIWEVERERDIMARKGDRCVFNVRNEQATIWEVWGCLYDNRYMSSRKTFHTFKRLAAFCARDDSRIFVRHYFPERAKRKKVRANPFQNCCGSPPSESKEFLADLREFQAQS